MPVSTMNAKLANTPMFHTEYHVHDDIALIIFLGRTGLGFAKPVGSTAIFFVVLDLSLFFSLKLE